MLHSTKSRLRAVLHSAELRFRAKVQSTNSLIFVTSLRIRNHMQKWFNPLNSDPSGIDWWKNFPWFFPLSSYDDSAYNFRTKKIHFNFSWRLGVKIPYKLQPMSKSIITHPHDATVTNLNTNIQNTQFMIGNLLRHCTVYILRNNFPTCLNLRTSL
jgi:hypothetical protein